MLFAGENAAYVQRDFFSDSNAIRHLFRSYVYRDLPRPEAIDAFLTPLVRGDLNRLVISNPFRDAVITAVYLRAKALKVPILVVERGATPDSVFLDTTGFLWDSRLYDREHWDNPLSTGERQKLEAAKAALRSSAEALEAQPDRRGAASIRARLLGGRRRLCAITLQTSSDAVVRTFHDEGFDYRFFKDELASIIADGPDDWSFAVKSHPREPIASIGGVATENTVHIADLIEAADAVVTFNSGTGITAFLHDKPVGCFGNAFYGGNGLTAALRGRDDLAAFLQNPGQSFDVESRSRFLHHLLFRIYSEFRFLGPLPGIESGKTVAMQARTIRLYDPDERRCRELHVDKQGLGDMLDREGERLRAWYRAGLNMLSRGQSQP